ncbi:MAG TPA: haloacid dehalogenase type II [Candidatus Binatia bacterium]|jgi:2-haloacid dehalogenase|nr:haloacid dehalogenase type II [Candidatus Binatia bacterium]
MLDLSRFECLSFDCYGTLIDWESGILGYLRPLLKGKGLNVADDEILNLYSEFEPQRQRPYQRYRNVLAAVVRDFGAHYAVAVTEQEANGLAESIRSWEPFADTVPALKKLKTRCKLAVLSNIDDDLFAFTAPKLGVELDTLVTAQQVESYKPSLSNFGTLLARLPISKERLLHVAESLYHDVVPAQSLGIATVWVNRRQGKQAAATKLIRAKADLEVPTVGALAEVMAAG